MLRITLSLLALTACSAFSQVKVSVKLDRPEYLVGEPVFVIVDVTNIGSEPIGYSGGDGRTDLTVADAQRKQPPNLHGCYIGVGFVSGLGFVSHPPLMPLGQTISSRHLLKGYRLPSGAYTLRASGRADVRWFFGSGRNSSTVSDRKSGDPVEGAAFDVSLSLNLRQGKEDELRQRYEPYVKEAVAGNGFGTASHQARNAIAEMAPPFLEKTILEFAQQPQDAAMAVEGLGQIPTHESRADLIQLFDRSADMHLRALIAEKLAGIATLEELPFFASLLPGRNTAPDDKIREYAILGLGRLGGDDAVKALQSLRANPNPNLRQSVALALGNTRSPAAVPILIEMYSDEAASNNACLSLATLTHYEWCGDAGTTAETQTMWRDWWRTHASRSTLFGMDQCIPLERLLPLVKE